MDAGPSDVLQHLLERSGLLRMPVEGQIDFVHKTFQEYLAGNAAVIADDIGILVKNAHDDQWREVILMAVAHARPQQTDELLRGILIRAEEESHHQHVLQVLAVGCIQHAPQLSQDLQKSLLRVTADLLPPKRMNQANALAGAGELVLELLADRKSYTVKEATTTIRMASRIGGDLALSIIAKCTRKLLSDSIETELMRAWPLFDPEEFARQVLAGSPFTRNLTIEDPALVVALRHLFVETLRCRFKHGFGSVDHIGGLRHLKVFSVLDPALDDLTPISGHPTLTELTLQEGTRAVDITPVGRCASLKSLAVPFSVIADPSHLRQITQVRALHLLDDVQLRILSENLADDLALEDFGLARARSVLGSLHHLAAVPQLSGLVRLTLMDAENLESIAGIERLADSLTSLKLMAPQVTDVERLADLSNLTHVDLTGTRVGSLDFVRHLPHLTTLKIGEHPLLPDLSPLCDVQSLRHLYLSTSHPSPLDSLAEARQPDLTVHVLDPSTVRWQEKLRHQSR